MGEDPLVLEIHHYIALILILKAQNKYAQWRVPLRLSIAISLTF